MTPKRAANSRMRNTAILAVVAVFASQLATADVRHSDIPKSLWGKWSPAADRCDNADRSAIVLAAKTYASSEMNCTIDWVSETAGGQGPIYSAHMQCAGKAEGAAKTISNLIFLPSGSNQISIGADFGDLKSYERCSTTEPVTER